MVQTQERARTVGLSWPGVPLLGRANELEIVARHLDRAASGAAQVLFLEGEAGIGKSRLVAEALHRAECQGFTVLSGAADELSRTRTFAPLVDALRLSRSSSDPNRVAAARLLAGEGIGPPNLSLPPEVHWRILEVILELVETMASRAPVILALEDLHWADVSTLSAVRAMARRLTTYPVALMGTLRPIPRMPELDRLVDDLVADGATCVVLGPLSQEAVEELVVEVVGAVPGPGLVEWSAGAAGNPLFLLELLRALLDEGTLEVTAGRAEIQRRSLPSNFTQLVLRRLRYLGEPTLEVLQVASVLGSVFSLADLSAVLVRPPTALMKAVNEAVAAGVIEEAEARLRFRHALIHQAMYGELPLNLRTVLHRQVGQALATAGAPAVQVAHHLAQGANPGDVEALSWLVRAARQAAPHAPAVAAGLFASAIELTPPLEPYRSRLLAERAMALIWAGQLVEGQELARQALERHPEPPVEAELRLGLGRALVVQGQAREAVTHLDAGACLPGLAESKRIELWAKASWARLLSGDMAGAAAKAESALAAGERLDNDLAICVALCTLSIIAHYRGEPARAVSLATRAMEYAGKGGPGEVHRRDPQLFLGVVFLDADRLDEAKQTLETGRRLGKEVGTFWALPLYHLWLAHYHAYVGNWDDAAVEADAALAQGEDMGFQGWLVEIHSLLARLAIHRDDLPAAESALARAQIAFTKSQDLLRVMRMQATQALFQEALGDAEGALRLLEAHWEMCVDMGAMLSMKYAGPDLVRLACSGGRRELARTVTEAVEEAAARAAVPSFEGAALRCRGLLEKDPDVLLEAVKAYRRSGRTVELAMALEDAAVALGQVKRLPEAQALMDEALGIYERVGALRDAARAVAALRSFGVHRGRRGPRRRPATGWASLTETEHRVVHLVAEGLTNAEVGRRLFISRSTVETHLVHIFAKLGVSSRRELTKMK